MTASRSSLIRLTGIAAITAVFLTGAVPAQDRAPGGVLIALERELRAIVQGVIPSVVTIRSTCRSDIDASRATTSPSLSVGSGVIMDSLGRVLTTARVVEDADDFWVEVSDGRVFQAILLGVRGEVAVLQINAPDVRTAPFDSAAELEVGSLVAAVGNSYGFPGGLSWGEVNGFRPDGTIQLSLGVSAGSSGGALVDARGRVVGMIRAKVSEPFYLDPLIVPSEGGGTIGLDPWPTAGIADLVSLAGNADRHRTPYGSPDH